MSKKLLNEKASIDWNNYLTTHEVEEFLNSTNKEQCAKDIINSKDFEVRYNDLHNDLQLKYKNSWNKNELVQDLIDFYNFGNFIYSNKDKNLILKQIKYITEKCIKSGLSKEFKYYLIPVMRDYQCKVDVVGDSRKNPYKYIVSKINEEDNLEDNLDLLDFIESYIREANKCYEDNNKLEESSNNKITLYHNTTNENALKINKEGIVPGKKMFAYGKGNEAEGDGVWCRNYRTYGNGGATITFEINEDDEALWKANDTDYVVYRTIKPQEIKDIDLMITTVKFNGHPIVESDIPVLIEKYGKKKILDVLRSRPNSFVEPYKFKYITKLLDTGEKYCKGKIKKVENKLQESKYVLRGIRDNKSFDVAYGDSEQKLNKFKDELTPGNPDVTFWIEDSKYTDKLEEASRNQLLAKTKMQTKTRYDKSDNYRGFGFKGIDTSNLLKDNTLPIVCKVGNYNDTVELQDVLYWLQEQAKRNANNKVDNHTVRDAILRAIDAMDIKVDCDCGDFKYRMAYQATQGDYKYGTPETRPANITNPSNYGALCKHLTAMLSNKKWLQKVAAPLLNWIEEHIDEVNKFLKVKPGQELLLPDEKARQLGKSGAASRQQGRIARLNEILKDFIRNRRNFILNNVNDDHELREGIKAYIKHEYTDETGSIDYLKADDVEIDYMLNKLNEWLLAKGYKKPIEDEETQEETTEENNKESEE